MCETEVPPIRKLDGGHHIKCHLDADILSKMDPVFALSRVGKTKKKVQKKVKS